MIKKALIFLSLMVGGFFALNSLVKNNETEESVTPPVTDTDRAAGKAKAGAGPTAQKTRSDPRRQGPGIRIKNDAKGSVIRSDYRGEWNFAGFREIRLPSGDLSRVKNYQVKARDSHTETDNRLMLEDVTVDFFALDNSDAHKPRAVKTGSMIAGRARVAFSQGTDQVIRPAEDKQMEFWDVTYSSVATSSLRGLTIKTGEARILNTPDRVRLWTPSKLEPVEILSSGRSGFRVTGKGLEAWIPSHRSKTGSLRPAAARNRNIIIFHDPLLTQGETLMASKGRLHIEENQQLASAIVTMTDDVRVESLRQLRSVGAAGSKSPGAQSTKIIAHGDTLWASFVRTAVNGKPTTAWTRLDLVGTPARLVDGQQIDLTSATITVLPDSEGRPYWFTAGGSDSTSPKMAFTQGGLTHNFKSSGQVHIIRTRREHGLMMKSFGVPMDGIPPQFDQLLVFEGKTEVRSPSEGLTLLASKGVTVVRSELVELRDTFQMRGLGEVDVRATTPGAAHASSQRGPASRFRGNLRVLGNRGFTLLQYPAKPGVGIRQTGEPGVIVVRSIQIGPEHQDGTHRYDLNYEAGNSKRDKVHVVGTGACAIKIRGPVVEHLAMASPNDDIAVTMSGPGHRLWQVGSVLAWFRPDNQLDRFVGKGAECHMAFKTRRGIVHGQAREIYQLEPDVYRLTGQLAELHEPDRGILRGRVIFVRQLSEEDLQMRATSDAYLQFLEDRSGRGAGTVTTANLYADEIRIEPFLVPPKAARVYEDLLPATPRLGLGTRHLFANGQVRFNFATKNTSTGAVDRGECHGTSLKMRSDRDGKIFSDGNIQGSPARFDSFDSKKQHTIARADSILFFLRKNEQYLTLDRTGERTPSLEWVGDLRGRPATVSGSGPDAGQSTTRLTCEGPIVIEPRRVIYKGPVYARSYDAQGQLDESGLALDAKNMAIDRTPDGLVDKIRADTEVVFAWSGARGTCDSLVIDMTQETLSAKGLARPAVIQLPNANLTARQVNYNYRTKMYTCWSGKFKLMPTTK